MSIEIANDVLRITVRKQMEYSTFFVREGTRAAGNHYCELTVNSSYGAVGYYWGSTGSPAHQFFANCDRSYILQKLWGDRYLVYNGRLAYQSLKQNLLKERRVGGCKRDEAREAWEDIEELGGCPDEYEYVAAVQGNKLLHNLAVEGVLDYRSPNPAALHFWEDFWTEFVQGLKQEWNRTHPTCDVCGAAMPMYFGGLQNHNPGCTQIPF